MFQAAHVSSETASNSGQNSPLHPGGKPSQTSHDSRPQESGRALPSRGGLTLPPDRKPAERDRLCSSLRMVDHYKAIRRAYKERKPTKTPKKKQKKPSVNSQMLSSTTERLEPGVLPPPPRGRRHRWPEACPPPRPQVGRPPLLQVLPAGSSPGPPVQAHGRCELARTQQAARRSLQPWGCGKTLGCLPLRGPPLKR